MSRIYKSKRGFTLMEIVLVLAIIVILAAVVGIELLFRVQFCCVSTNFVSIPVFPSGNSCDSRIYSHRLDRLWYPDHE